MARFGGVAGRGAGSQQGPASPLSGALNNLSPARLRPVCRIRTNRHHAHDTGVLGHPRGGETEEEKIRVDILENQAMDVSNQLARVCYSPDFEKLKPEYLEGLPTMVQHFSQFLGKRPWFVGDKITFVDFLAYDVLDLHRIFEPKCLDAFPNLKDFISRFEGLEKISAYMKSSRFLPKPLYTRVAVWGNK
ncbi:glutathione S-transferase Mu 1 isoform X4 [Hylobates moloch]|uniref:glutathione S-transferase Mu 1 isoform X4 n=1 Tax=Hylobates moloch TaxID=81572 RepID=UPI002676207E|nr:glutathione S-transferase Mu 1 isoform X4 [Hylobates moloch]